MKKHGIIVTGLSLLVLPAVFMIGCEREVASSRETKVTDNGTVRTKETVVKETPSGTIVEQRRSVDRPKVDIDD